MKRGSPGDREPVIIATGQNAGLLFEDGYVAATTGSPYVFGTFRAAAFIVSSSKEGKSGMRPATFKGGRTSWDVIEGSPAYDFYYKDDKAPPEFAEDIDGQPVMARIRNPRLTDEQFDRLPDDPMPRR